MDITLASQKNGICCGEAGPIHLAENPVPDDKTFYEDLIAPIESQMMRSIWHVVRQSELAEDALQDALAIIWRKRHVIRRHPNPRALILKMCLDAARDSLRKRYRFLPRHTASLSAERQDIADPSEIGRQKRKQLEDEVLKTIIRLPKKQAAAVLMRIVQDQPYDTIAAALGCSEITARILVSKGRARLGRWLSYLRPDSLKEGSR